MQLEGIVTNVANFGAFIDIGVHQDGLVHVSQLANQFVKDPKDIVKVGQVVKVQVMEVNEALKRISLSMKAIASSSSASPHSVGHPATRSREAMQRTPQRRSSASPRTESATRSKPRPVQKPRKTAQSEKASDHPQNQEPASLERKS